MLRERIHECCLWQEQKKKKTRSHNEEGILDFFFLQYRAEQKERRKLMNTPEMGEILEVRVLEYDFAGTRTRKSPYSPTS
jgi:hypothetical protein